MPARWRHRPARSACARDVCRPLRPTRASLTELAEGLLMAAHWQASKPEHAVIRLWTTGTWAPAGELAAHTLTVTQVRHRRSRRFRQPHQPGVDVLNRSPHRSRRPHQPGSMSSTAVPIVPANPTNTDRCPKPRSPSFPPTPPIRVDVLNRRPHYSRDPVNVLNRRLCGHCVRSLSFRQTTAGC